MTESGEDGPGSKDVVLASREIPEETPPSTTVVRVVAQARGDALTDLPTLYQVVDPDALDVLVRQATEDGMVVGFDFAGHEIQVTGDSVVRVLA